MAFPPLVAELLAQQDYVRLRTRVTEAVLMVDKYGTMKWHFHSGGYAVLLDFAANRVVVVHATGASDTVSLDEFMQHLRVSF